MPEHEMKKSYGRMAGTPGDPEHCIKRVGEPPHYLDSHQCTRKRGHGPEKAYCRQHAKILEG